MHGFTTPGGQCLAPARRTLNFQHVTDLGDPMNSDFLENMLIHVDVFPCIKCRRKLRFGIGSCGILIWWPPKIGGI